MLFNKNPLRLWMIIQKLVLLERSYSLLYRNLVENKNYNLSNSALSLLKKSQFLVDELANAYLYKNLNPLQQMDKTLTNLRNETIPNYLKKSNGVDALILASLMEVVRNIHLPCMEMIYALIPEKVSLEVDLNHQ